MARRSYLDTFAVMETTETAIIGGGQAGLAVGYHLQKLGRPFVILDANARVGDGWRLRWDSLRLFTPARFSALEGMPFPPVASGFPTKDQMADYLEAYARRFNLQVRNNARVQRLSRSGGHFEISTSGQKLRAENVVVAMSSTQVPRVPPFASQLSDRVLQVHSADYRNPTQLKEGGVLVVGVGNSGADIALEVVKTRPTWIAGKETGAIPWRIEPWFARQVLFRILRFMFHHVLTIKTPIGRKARPAMLTRSTPLIRVKPRDLTAAGVSRTPRIVGVRDGLPVTEDGKTLDVANIIWCTGFRSGFSWIDLPVLGEQGEPDHQAGVVVTEPGLYFVGLHFLYSVSSETLMGVNRDAARIARRIAAARRTEVAMSSEPSGKAVAVGAGQ
jgi:putative flavoprotein involved in K+ transport